MVKIESQDVIFQGSVRFEIHPVVHVDTLFPARAVPDVKNQTVFRSPPSPTTVTNFTGGINGQTIRILGNGNLTVSNNANIKTNTAANKVLAANKVYVFTMIDNIWYEDA